MGQTTERDLLHLCAQHLDAYKCPRRILVRDDLPRNVHGYPTESAFDRLNDYRSLMTGRDKLPIGRENKPPCWSAFDERLNVDKPS